MYKSILLLVFMFALQAGYSQKKVEKHFNKATNLIEATYYNENGIVSQEGTFNTEGKLHGEWTSYNDKGERVAVGKYNNGVKTGTWYFWANDILREVEFSNNQIASVTEAKSTSGIVNHE